MHIPVLVVITNCRSTLNRECKAVLHFVPGNGYSQCSEWSGSSERRFQSEIAKVIEADSRSCHIE